MKTFTNYAEKKAKQILNLLQGYTKGIRTTAILILLLMGVSNAWAWDISAGSHIYLVNTDNWSGCQLYIWKSDGYNTSYTFSKITNTNIYHYHFANSWNGYEGVKFRSDNDWSNQSSGNINKSLSSCYFVGTGTTNYTTLANMNGAAKVVSMVSIGGNYTEQANSACIAKVSGYNLAEKASSTNEVNASTGSASNASIKAAYGSTITYTATAGTGYTFKGFSTSNSTSLPSSPSASGTTATANKYGSSANNTTYYAYFKANQYTVKFDANGGTGSMSNQSHTYGVSKALTANAFTQTGYTFAGWNTKADGTGTSYTDKQSVSNLSSTDGGSVTLYAQWTVIPVNSHNITYTTQGTGWTYGASNPTSAEEGATVTFVVNPTAGYRVSVSSDGPALTGPNGSNQYTFTMPTKDVKITVDAKPEQYTVTLNKQSGEGGTSSVTATYAAAMPTITPPTRIGYTFNGYFDATSGGNKYYNANGSSAKNWDKTSNTTLYAQWTANTYSITYKDQGDIDFSGSHENGAPTQHTYGTATTLSTANKTGYTFDGWFTKSDCSGTAVTSLGATTYTSDITLYAKWTEIPPTTVYLKPNDNWKQANARFAIYCWNNEGNIWYDMTKMDCDGGNYYMVEIPVAYKDFKFVRLNPATTENNWNEGTKWNETGDLKVPTDSKVLYTVTEWGNGSWGTYSAPQYAITITNGTGGTVTVKQEANTITSGNKVNLNAVITATLAANDGYSKGTTKIKIGDNAEADLVEGQEYTICGPTTITGNWTAKTYTVTLDLQSGTDGTTSVTATYGSAMPSITKPTRIGYTFNGYYDATSGGTQYYKADGSSARTWNKTSNSTLYAQWTPHTYTVKFDKNDGEATGTMADQSFTYDETKKLTANAFEKENWKFKEWNTKADGSGTPYSDQHSVSNLTTTNNGVVNLYAQWAPAQDVYTITIRANGNGTVSPESVIVNKSITAEVTATPNEGHKFIGWKTEGGAEVADKDPVSTANASSTTVTAVAAGSVTANFEALLPNTLTLTQQAMYKERVNPIDGVPGCDGTEANPYKIYSEEFVRITAAALPEVEGLTAYYKFGDTPEQESNVFDFSDISGSTPTKINVKAYYKKNDAVWGGEVSADSYYFIIIPLPYYISTVPAGEMSIDRIAEGENILVQFRSDDKTTVKLYVQKGDDNSTKKFLTQISDTASYDYTYDVPDNINPCVLRFIAESEGLHNGRSFSKYAEVALYKNVTIKVNDPNSLLRNVYLWRGGDGSESADVKTEWPGEDFIQTFGTWRIFVVKYPYYDHFIVNDGSNDNQTFDYEITGVDTCYQLSEEKEHRDEYYNYTLTETTCPPDLMVSDIEDVTIMEGEQIVVMPEIFVGLGYQLSDVEVDVLNNSNPSCVSTMASGTNITVLGISEGEANITVTYKLGDDIVQDTFNVRVNKKTHITIQIKVPTQHGPEADRIGWWETDKVYVRYWNKENNGTDLQMTHLTTTDYHYYFEALVPLDSEGKTNFNIFYDNRNEDWRYSTNATNVTEDGCYLVYNDGSGDRGLRYEDVRCLTTEYIVKILMGSGKTYTSNIVSSAEDKLSFFAPGVNEVGYKAGAVLLYEKRYLEDDVLIATIHPDTFKTSNVYTAIVNAAGNGLDSVKPYTGNYYIRTWGKDDDINNKGIQSVSTWTDEEKKSRTFTYFISREGEFYNHYWVQTMNPHDGGKDVSAWVANDYNDDLAGKLTKGKGTDDNGDIKFDNSINVRFGYDPRTNYFGRAILKGSTSESNYHHNFLNIHCDNAYNDKNCTTKLPYGSGQSGQDNMMQDISNWVYQRDFYVPITNNKPSASLYIEATSPSNVMSVTDHLLGYVTNEVTGEESNTPVQRTIIGSGTTNGTYLMRVVYDFKTNRIIAAWLPQGTIEVSRSETLNSDVLFVRTENEDVPQINLSGNGEKRSLESMFFAMELHRGDKNAVRHEEQYFFTLPFNSIVGSISGVPGYMQTWGIQRYRGDLRAEKGWFIDTPTFWEWMSLTDTLYAGEGYLLVFDKKAAQWTDIIVDTYDAEGNKTGQKEVSMMRLYFPSITSGFDLKQQSAEHLTVTYPDHTCTITYKDRDKQDSNWKVIGTTSYNNAGIASYTKDTVPGYEEWKEGAPSFRYAYSYTFDGNNNRTSYEYTPELGFGNGVTYKSFFGYMVQFAGTINWQPIMSETVPEGIAARRYVPANERTSFTTRLELTNATGEKQDQTFVALDEKATITFDQNKDLNKVMNSNKANIYTLSEDIPFAGNTLPMEKATVPVGVRIATAGEYTFRMPDGTDGIAVTLVDNATGTHTNMLMDEYTVTLDAGTIENRFYLVVDPDRTATSVENIGEEAKGDKSKGVEKFLIDGKLFIRTADGIFDAKGQRL